LNSKEALLVINEQIPLIVSHWFSFFFIFYHFTNILSSVLPVSSNISSYHQWNQLEDWKKNLTWKEGRRGDSKSNEKNNDWTARGGNCFIAYVAPDTLDSGVIITHMFDKRGTIIISRCLI